MNPESAGKFDYKFDMEAYLRSNASFEHTFITSSFVLVLFEILSIFKMNAYRGDGYMCDLSYRQIAKTIRLSIPTVKRMINIAIQNDWLKSDGYTETGERILIAGKFLDERKAAYLAKEKTKRCGTIATSTEPQNTTTVDNSGDNELPPIHHDLPPPITMNTPPDHHDLHITDAFTDSFDQTACTSQQVQNLIKTITEKKTMHHREDDRPLPYVNPFKAKRPELPEDHGIKALREYGKMLNREQDLNH